MKRSTKAALLSALIFPGAGHMFLKRYVRGSVLMLAALAAFSVAVDPVIQGALTVADRINSGDMPLEAGTVADMVSSGADSPIAHVALLALGACWLIGIIDTFRLGLERDRGPETDDS